MARVTATDYRTPARLEQGWTLALSAAGACHDPRAAENLVDWLPAPVPGTVAQALEAAGRWSRTSPQPLHDQDVWYRTTVSDRGPRTLRFEGLATVCEVWLDDERLFTSGSMFLAHEIDVDLAGDDILWLCFRALSPHIEAKGPRARWRPQMITPPGVRLVRTTLLGHMPGWCPSFDVVGPWRPVLEIERSPAPRLVETDIRAEHRDDVSRLVADVRIEGATTHAELQCAGSAVILSQVEPGRFSGELTVANAEPWWPHTHGAQPLYPVVLRVGETTFDLGRTGFRSVEVDRGADGRGFALRINGEPVFCRGACWNPPDLVTLSGERADYEPRLHLAREAGMNMIRVGGTGVYESPDFHRLCDELGILVWQDCMFANFDYPAKDEAWLEIAQAEAERLLDDLQLSPSLAVLCGGSEVQQQAAMMGLPAAALSSPLFDEVLPAVAERLRPDLPYVASSPSGGALPFTADTGVTHYYGVGAYCRPLEDARRAEVKFAAECLAFANLPQPASLARDLPGVQPVHDPRWKAGVPRDRGATWDFEDIRDHYLQLLYGRDPQRLRREDPALYLDLSRAVSGEVMEAVFAEWRRGRSSCAGALVWTLQDLQPGAGWGVIDASGEPKPAWYALKRAFRPVQLTLTDEGCNGLAVHLINETPAAVAAVLHLTCLRGGVQPVVQARRELTLAPRSVQELSAFELFGAFFDVSYAYRFGPPAHDVTVATLTDAETGAVLAEAFDFPTGRAAAEGRPEITVSVERDSAGWSLVLASDRLAQSVHIEDAGFRPDDDGFHLSPLAPRRVRLHARDGAQADARPFGEVRAPGGRNVVAYAA